MRGSEPDRVPHHASAGGAAVRPAPRNTFLPPLITNVLYFAVFGVVLGNRIREIQGFDYITFILPGLVVLGAISNSFENSKSRRDLCVQKVL